MEQADGGQAAQANAVMAVLACLPDRQGKQTAQPGDRAALRAKFMAHHSGAHPAKLADFISRKRTSAGRQGPEAKGQPECLNRKSPYSFHRKGLILMWRARRDSNS